MLESQILSLSPPGSRMLAAFRRWFGSEGTPVLWGHDEQLFSYEHDLVALASVDTDRLNIFLKDHFGYLFKVSTQSYDGNDIIALPSYIQGRAKYV